MRLTIFGASGQTGRLVLGQALAARHDVSVMVRNPAKLGPAGDRVRVVQGAADQPQAIREAVEGSSAVISTMGAGQGTLAAFGPSLVSAMRSAGVTRLVALAGASIAVRGDRRSLSHALLRAITRFLARDVLADGERHVAEVMASSLDYTLVRPPRLTNGSATGHVRHGTRLRVGPMSSISRADLAAFMLAAATDGAYWREAPLVASSA